MTCTHLCPISASEITLRIYISAGWVHTNIHFLTHLGPRCCPLSGLRGRTKGGASGNTWVPHDEIAGRGRWCTHHRLRQNRRALLKPCAPRCCSAAQTNVLLILRLAKSEKWVHPIVAIQPSECTRCSPTHTRLWPVSTNQPTQVNTRTHPNAAASLPRPRQEAGHRCRVAQIIGHDTYQGSA